ncbi:Uncharacterised protein [Yersinia ruckeri]|uniref:Uncharacterized protein n=1 Tax=Yersinia ruckeri TaxID=29486 RepID=A0A380SAN6_YERRU|nr:Uncharacterised protein [Yersinia ruckeri]CNI50065.1 Uncharacterised protein [Yersinia ruckeri]SUQ37283.1 Uncharacterised protein [Yersinia ruckeri]
MFILGLLYSGCAGFRGEELLKRIANMELAKTD